MEKIYIYFNRKKIILYSLAAAAWAIFFGYVLYHAIFFDCEYIQIEAWPYDQYAQAWLTKVPFVFPDSLWRVDWYMLILFVIGVVCLGNLVKNLFYSGPILIFSNEGIHHYKLGLIAWSDVQKIESLKSRRNNIMAIKLKNPEKYFGKYMTFLGNRRIVIDESIHYNKIIHFYEQASSLNKERIS